MNYHQLSRPRRTSYYMASAGTTYLHTASDAVGWSSRENWTRKRAAVGVWRGGDLANPPQDLGGVYRSQMAEAAPARFMLSSEWVLMKVCGEPVSKRATRLSFTATRRLWMLILMVKEESSIDILHQQQDKAHAWRAREGADRSGRRTSQRGHCRRSPKALLGRSRGSPTGRRLLTFPLDTVAVAWKGPLRRCNLYWRARSLEETNLCGASVAVRGPGRDVARFAESYLEM